MAGTHRRTSEAKRLAARKARIIPRASAWTLTAACLVLAGPAMAEDRCPQDPSCGYRWPNVLYMVDYSTAMNSKFDGDMSRWEATITALTSVMQTKFILERFHHAFIRFGHDPSLVPGTLIPGDVSEPPLIDGQALDHYWYDPMGEDPAFYHCVSEEITEALEGVPPPANGLEDGIGRWTKGAFDRSVALIAESKADHPWDEDKRVYANVAITAGAWTDPTSDQELAPPGEDPAITAAMLWENQEIRTHVIYIGDPKDTAARAAADELALAGATTSAHLAENTDELSGSLMTIAESIRDDAQKPSCTSSLMRLMVLLDASSAMLNVDGGTVAGAEGTIGWDHARVVIGSLLETTVNQDMWAEDVMLVGLTVFGDDEPAPGEDKLVVDYGECRRDNLAWALAPQTSCIDGCDDPWGGPPIDWTFGDGALLEPPLFAHSTISHMPQCSGDQPYCAGSGGFVHLGLQRVRARQIAFHAASLESQADYPADVETTYLNLLVTNGLYEGYSTDAQVQAELEAMYNSGITTMVLALGDGADSPGAVDKLQKMALWGSGGQLQHYDVESIVELRGELKDRIEGLEFGPCCTIQDCALSPEPGVLHECFPGKEGCWEETDACRLDPDDELYHCVNTCGDGIVDPHEECDDGNVDDIDGCSSSCNVEEPGVCGNGVHEWGEECDDGNSNEDKCTKECKFPGVCGDGDVESGEECDDGNSEDDDECSNTCTLNPVCGDGALDPGEACDDGNSVDDDECSNACALNQACGDGVVDPGEACDDGNSIDDDGCTNACTLMTAECGDGVVDPGEACDDGNSIDDDGCTNACTLRSGECGDGAVDPGEACDDGNSVDDDECTNSCEAPRCGDAILQASELCDDGNSIDDDECRNDCSLPGIVSEGGCECTLSTEPAQRDRNLLGLALGVGLLAWSRRRR